MKNLPILIRNVKIIFPTSILPGTVIVEDGKIKDVICGNPQIDVEQMQVVDGEENYLSPGFIDVHTHGAGNADFMDATETAVQTAIKMHLQHGTTSIVPTTLTSTKESLMEFLKFFNSIPLVSEGYPEILGLHLEGPYFSEKQRGAQDKKYLRNPEAEEYMEAFKISNRIIRWSFAVELPGSEEFLKQLKQRNIVASLAHSDADCRTVMRAYDEGVSALTHFYSCMSGVTRKNAYRVAGAIEAGYLLDDLYVEVIADGCHLPGELLKLIYKIKSSSRICLVTDSMRAAGMPDGIYKLGALGRGQESIIEDGVAKVMDRSAFAGSVATMDRLVRTFWKLTGAPLHEVVRMATLSPASLIGVQDRKGSISCGKDADLLIFDENISIKKMMIRGEWV